MLKQPTKFVLSRALLETHIQADVIDLTGEPLAKSTIIALLDDIAAQFQKPTITPVPTLDAVELTKADYGDWQGLPIIAIGPKGGKIVGYGSDGKAIYTTNPKAAKLAAQKKLVSEGQKKQATGEWLLTLGVPSKIMGTGANTIVRVSHASAKLLTTAFGIQPLESMATPSFTHFSAKSLSLFIGQAFAPPAEGEAGYQASVAAGEDLDAEIPDLSTLKQVSLTGKWAGGSHEGMKLFEDSKGRKWLFKTANSTIARAEEAACRIGRLVLGGIVQPAKYVDINGSKGVLIGEVPGKALNPTGHSSPPANLLQKHFDEVVQHQVVDWLTSQHDGHAGNYLSDGKHLYGIDKGQAWRFHGQDSLNTHYSPNNSNQIFLPFWKAYQQGQLTGDPVAAAAKAVDAAEKITPEQFKAIVMPYAQAQGNWAGTDPEALADKVTARLGTLRADWEAFLTQVTGAPVTLPKKSADNFETMPEVEAKPGDDGEPLPKMGKAEIAMALNDMPIGTVIKYTATGGSKIELKRIGPNKWQGSKDGKDHPATTTTIQTSEALKHAFTMALAPIVYKPAAAEEPKVKAVIKDPAAPPAIVGGATEPISEAVPGWPQTKGHVTIFNPGEPPTGKYPKGYPGPGFKAQTKYKGQLYTIEFEAGGPKGVLINVYWPDGSSDTFNSPNKAGDAVQLHGKGMDVHMSGKDKKTNGISYPLNKMLKLKDFQKELEQGAMAPPPAPVESFPETVKEVPAGGQPLPDGLVTDMSLLPSFVQTYIEHSHEQKVGPAYGKNPPPGTVFKAGGTLYLVGMTPYGNCTYAQYSDAGTLVKLYQPNELKISLPPDVLTTIVAATDVSPQATATPQMDVGAPPEVELPATAKTPPGPQTKEGFTPGTSIKVKKQDEVAGKKIDCTLTFDESGEKWTASFIDTNGDFQSKEGPNISSVTKWLWVQLKGYDNPKSYKVATGKTAPGVNWGFWGISTKTQPKENFETMPPQDAPGVSEPAPASGVLQQLTQAAADSAVFWEVDGQEHKLSKRLDGSWVYDEPSDKAGLTITSESAAKVISEPGVEGLELDLEMPAQPPVAEAMASAVGGEWKTTGVPPSADNPFGVDTASIGSLIEKQPTAEKMGSLPSGTTFMIEYPSGSKTLLHKTEKGWEESQYVPTIKTWTQPGVNIYAHADLGTALKNGFDVFVRTPDEPAYPEGIEDTSFGSVPAWDPTQVVPMPSAKELEDVPVGTLIAQSLPHENGVRWDFYRKVADTVYPATKGDWAHVTHNAGKWFDHGAEYTTTPINFAFSGTGEAMVVKPSQASDASPTVEWLEGKPKGTKLKVDDPETGIEFQYERGDHNWEMTAIVMPDGKVISGQHGIKPNNQLLESIQASKGAYQFENVTDLLPDGAVIPNWASMPPTIPHGAKIIGKYVDDGQLHTGVFTNTADGWTLQTFKGSESIGPAHPADSWIEEFLDDADVTSHYFGADMSLEDAMAQTPGPDDPEVVPTADFPNWTGDPKKADLEAMPMGSVLIVPTADEDYYYHVKKTEFGWAFRNQDDSFLGNYSDPAAAQKIAQEGYQYAVPYPPGTAVDSPSIKYTHSPSENKKHAKAAWDAWQAGALPTTGAQFNTKMLTTPAGTVFGIVGEDGQFSASMQVQPDKTLKNVNTGGDVNVSFIAKELDDNSITITSWTEPPTSFTGAASDLLVKHPLLEKYGAKVKLKKSNKAGHMNVVITKSGQAGVEELSQVLSELGINAAFPTHPKLSYGGAMATISNEQLTKQVTVDWDPGNLAQPASVAKKKKADAKLKAIADAEYQKALAKAKEITEWQGKHPLPTGKTVDALALWQELMPAELEGKVYAVEGVPSTPGFKLWLGAPEAHDALAEDLQSIGAKTKAVETPLGTFLEIDTDVLVKEFLGSQPDITGPDGKTYPAGTTFKEDSESKTVKAWLEPQIYKFKPHKSKDNWSVMKLTGSNDEQVAEATQLLGKYFPQSLQTEHGMKPPFKGGSNTIAEIPDELLGKQYTETTVTPTLPKQPKAFKWRPLPSVGTQKVGALAGNNRADLSTIKTVAIPKQEGHTVRMGRALNDMQVRVRKVKVDGQRYYEVSGKLAEMPTNPQMTQGVHTCGSGMTTKVKGSSYSSTKMDSEDFAEQKASDGIGSWDMPGLRHTFDNGTDLTLFNTKNAAYKRFITRIPESADVEDEVAKCFAQMGVDVDGAMNTQEADERIYIKREILRMHHGPWGKERLPIPPTEAGLDAALAKHPGAAALVAQAEIRVGVNGHQYVYLPDRKLPHCDLISGSVNSETAAISLVEFARGMGGGYGAQVNRMLMGRRVGNTSPEKDLNNGGGQFAFTKTHSSKASNDAASDFYHSDAWVIHPRVLKRADWFSYNDDGYGNVWGHGNGSGVFEDAKANGQHVGNDFETLFPEGVAIEDMAGFCVTSPERYEKMMSIFKANGVTEINGKPIAEFVQYHSTGTSTKILADKFKTEKE